MYCKTVQFVDMSENKMSGLLCSTMNICLYSKLRKLTYISNIN